MSSPRRGSSGAEGVWTFSEPGRFKGRRNRSWPCPAPARFSLLVTYRRNDIGLHLGGDLREADLIALDDCLAAAVSERPSSLVLDLCELASSDGPGIKYIRAARRRVAQQDIQLIVDSPDADILRALTRGGARFFVRAAQN